MPNTIFLQRVADLYDTFKQHDSQQSDRLQRYRNIEVESAQLISQLIRMQQARSRQSDSKTTTPSSSYAFCSDSATS